jgi:hypothetical protein
MLASLVQSWMRRGMSSFDVSARESVPCENACPYHYIDHNIRLTDEDLEAINDTSVPLHREGGHLGMMTVFHELHCLVSPFHDGFVNCPNMI